MKKVNILSLDGAGIRVIITAVVLSEIEKVLHHYQPKLHLSNVFDLVAGSGTGGILGLMLLAPDAKGKPAYTAQNALEFWMQEGHEIFDVSIRQKLRSLGGLKDEKYSSKSLEKKMQKIFGELKLSDALKPCLITAYDIRNRKTHFFNKTDTRSAVRNYLLRDVARATVAMPTYFETARIKTIYDTPYALIYGALFAANPAMCAYAEARTLDFQKTLNDKEKPCYPHEEEMIMVSISAGKSQNPYFYDKAKDWGAVQWLKPLFDMMNSANCETVDYQARQVLEKGSASQIYFRLDPPLGPASAEVDDASPENINLLQQQAQNFCQQNREIIEQMVQTALTQI